ncbi:tubulin polyglutamylase complex subunit 2-like [Coccinella septempunctata]|uniref:tubulin polyglutamylase complex subunit 2-like n=1 Tax=Coccinella septempunctata TaxID=41139 RepID=UPI001D07CAF6|nr:tubulin polyglutamylase complex subunit 2-like [Coccinella septempunctata]
MKRIKKNFKIDSLIVKWILSYYLNKKAIVEITRERKMNRNNMGFFVDKVSEDSFYQNLLIGLPNVLDKLPNIHEKKLNRYPPATKLQVRNWENSNGVNLPQDLHDFYLSCNGLSYTYTFSYEPTNREDQKINKLHAKIEINPIENLILIVGYEIKSTARIYYDGYFYKLDLSAESKVFELSKNENFQVVLVYTDRKNLSSIWIYKNGIFYFTASDVTTYLRMAIAHLGAPGWQYIFSPLVLPGRTREMLNVIAPSILTRTLNQDSNVAELNVINPNLFNVDYEGMNESKKCNETLLNKKFSANTIGRKSSSATIGRKSSTATIGRKASSVVSSNSEKLKKRTISKRRPFTPRF